MFLVGAGVGLKNTPTYTDEQKNTATSLRLHTTAVCCINGSRESTLPTYFRTRTLLLCTYSAVCCRQHAPAAAGHATCSAGYNTVRCAPGVWLAH